MREAQVQGNDGTGPLRSKSQLAGLGLPRGQIGMNNAGLRCKLLMPMIASDHRGLRSDSWRPMAKWNVE